MVPPDKPVTLHVNIKVSLPLTTNAPVVSGDTDTSTAGSTKCIFTVTSLLSHNGIVIKPFRTTCMVPLKGQCCSCTRLICKYSIK